MLMVIAASSYISIVMKILIGLFVVLFKTRIWVLVERHKGRADSRTTTIATVILYILIIAGMLILFVGRYSKVQFGCFLLFTDLFLWRCFPVMDQGDMSVVENKCDLCSNNLHGAGKPHIYGGHGVCGKCHIIIEEAKKEERDS